MGVVMVIVIENGEPNSDSEQDCLHFLSYCHWERYESISSLSSYR